MLKTTFGLILFLKIMNDNFYNPQKSPKKLVKILKIRRSKGLMRNRKYNVKNAHKNVVINTNVVINKNVVINTNVVISKNVVINKNVSH